MTMLHLIYLLYGFMCSWSWCLTWGGYIVDSIGYIVYIGYVVSVKSFTSVIFISYNVVGYIVYIGFYMG